MGTPCHPLDLLASLRQENGDIIVRLSPVEEEWLVLERNELRRLAPTIDAITTNWSIPARLVYHPVTGLPQLMWTLTLVYEDGNNTFSLSPFLGPDDPFPPFNDTDLPVTDDMTPKFNPNTYQTNYDLKRDQRQDNIHPGLLAAHDLFNMFCVIYNLPLHMEHLPYFQPQPSPEWVLRYGVERFASTVTYLDYYVGIAAGAVPDPMIPFRDMLMSYLYENVPGSYFGPFGAWQDLLHLSQGLQFPELYIFVILFMSQAELERATLQRLQYVLGLSSVNRVRILMKNAREIYWQHYQDRLGMIVHVPLLHLGDYRALPLSFSMNAQADHKLSANAAVLAGTIWEAQMRTSAYWRRLQWYPDQDTDRSPRPRWRQRFPRYGFNSSFAMREPGKWPDVRYNIVPDDTDPAFMQPNEVTDSQFEDITWRHFTTQLTPAILKHAADENPYIKTENLPDAVLYPNIVETYTNLAWEHDSGARLLRANGWPTGMVTDLLSDTATRDDFQDRVGRDVNKTILIASNIIRSSLEPPPGLWDLTFCGTRFTWARVRAPDEPGWTLGYDLWILGTRLADEEDGVVRQPEDFRPPRPQGPLGLPWPNMVLPSADNTPANFEDYPTPEDPNYLGGIPFVSPEPESDDASSRGNYYSPQTIDGNEGIYEGSVSPEEEEEEEEEDDSDGEIVGQTTRNDDGDVFGSHGNMPGFDAGWHRPASRQASLGRTSATPPSRRASLGRTSASSGRTRTPPYHPPSQIPTLGYGGLRRSPRNSQVPTLGYGGLRRSPRSSLLPTRGGVNRLATYGNARARGGGRGRGRGGRPPPAPLTRPRWRF